MDSPSKEGSAPKGNDQPTLDYKSEEQGKLARNKTTKTLAEAQTTIRKSQRIAKRKREQFKTIALGTQEQSGRKVTSKEKYKSASRPKSKTKINAPETSDSHQRVNLFAHSSSEFSCGIPEHAGLDNLEDTPFCLLGTSTVQRSSSSKKPSAFTMSHFTPLENYSSSSAALLDSEFIQTTDPVSLLPYHEQDMKHLSKRYQESTSLRPPALSALAKKGSTSKTNITRDSFSEEKGYVNQLLANPTPPAPRFYSLVSRSTDIVCQHEFDFMVRHLKVLESAMSKLNEYYLLTPVRFEELRMIKSTPLTVSGSIEVSPASTIFYPAPSRKFLHFSRLWHFINIYYAKLPIESEYTREYQQAHLLQQFASSSYQSNPRTSKALIHANINNYPGLAQLQHVSYDQGSNRTRSPQLFELNRKELIAETIEEAAFVAEQKVREIYGMYKLIVNRKVMSKAEAAKKMQDCGIYPAKRLLLWAEEFFINGGRFSRY